MPLSRDLNAYHHHHFTAHIADVAPHWQPELYIIIFIIISIIVNNLFVPRPAAAALAGLPQAGEYDSPPPPPPPLEAAEEGEYEDVAAISPPPPLGAGEDDLFERGDEDGSSLTKPPFSYLSHSFL